LPYLGVEIFVGYFYDYKATKGLAQKPFCTVARKRRRQCKPQELKFFENYFYSKN